MAGIEIDLTPREMLSVEITIMETGAPNVWDDTLTWQDSEVWNDVENN